MDLTIKDLNNINDMEFEYPFKKCIYEYYQKHKEEINKDTEMLLNRTYTFRSKDYGDLYSFELSNDKPDTINITFFLGESYNHTVKSFSHKELLTHSVKDLREILYPIVCENIIKMKRQQMLLMLHGVR